MREKTYIKKMTSEKKDIGIKKIYIIYKNKYI